MCVLKSKLRHNASDIGKTRQIEKIATVMQFAKQDKLTELPYTRSQQSTLIIHSFISLLPTNADN